MQQNHLSDVSIELNLSFLYALLLHSNCQFELICHHTHTIS
jgi:hypothetical protein